MPTPKKKPSRAKKNMAKNTGKNSTVKKRTARRTAKTQHKSILSLKNIPTLGLTALFCLGIMLGAFMLNRAYTLHIENIELAEAEQWAAERAQQALIHQNRLASERLRLKIQQERKQEKLNQQKAQHLKEQQQKVALQPSKKTLFSNYVPAPNSHIMAIVIDDIGYKRQEGERTLSLPGKLTVAVLPFTPYAKTLAQQAPAQNKEVMLHAPMEPKKLSYWGEGLTSAMTRTQLQHDFIAMINDIPNLMGVNNHMGSGLTENTQIMEWLMAELPARGLYFIDSRTSAKSAAYNAAQKLGIPAYKRDIFLDNNRNINDINTQFDQLIETTLNKGMALGIGHPYPETLAVLEQRMPELKKLGIELVTVSELLNARSHRTELAWEAKLKTHKIN